MKLTKEQIDYIENRLIKNGIKYWDIRIELLDHVVSDVESKLETQEDFKKAVHNSFIFLGWNGSFEDLIDKKLKENQVINNPFKDILKSFTKIKYILLYLFIFSVLWSFKENESFFKTGVILVISFYLIFIIYSFLNYKKLYKSAALLSAVSNAVLPMSLINVYLYLPKIYSNSKTPAEVDVLILFMTFVLCLFIAKKLITRLQKVDLIYKELQKL